MCICRSVVFVHQQKIKLTFLVILPLWSASISLKAFSFLVSSPENSAQESIPSLSLSWVSNNSSTSSLSINQSINKYRVNLIFTNYHPSPSFIIVTFHSFGKETNFDISTPALVSAWCQSSLEISPSPSLSALDSSFQTPCLPWTHQFKILVCPGFCRILNEQLFERRHKSHLC